VLYWRGGFLKSDLASEESTARVGETKNQAPQSRKTKSSDGGENLRNVFMATKWRGCYRRILTQIKREICR